jgi:hypothetical protein
MLLGLGAVFTRIGEDTASWLIKVVSPAETSPSATPTLTRDALTVAVRTDIGDAGDSLALRAQVSDGPIASNLVAGKPGEPWESFLEHHEGAPVGTLVVSLVLTGHRDPGVRIIGIGVEKVQTEPVLAGTSIKLNSAGEAASIELAANLDETRPKILSNGAPYFPGRNITLKNGEQENLKVSLTASAKLYRWTFVIDYVDEAGAAHKVFVNRLGRTFPDPSGSPLGELFTLTGAAPSYGAAWVENFQFPGFQPRT